MDVDNIPVGINFEEYLNNQVAQCDAMLSVIGPSWLSAKDEANQLRLDKPDDFVAIEIAAALARNGRYGRPRRSRRPALRQTTAAGSGDPSLRLGQFGLNHASSLGQGFHFPFRRRDDLLRERCEQWLKPLIPVDRKHPFVLPIVLEHRIGLR
jgi:hypothetical protein